MVVFVNTSRGITFANSKIVRYGTVAQGIDWGDLRHWSCNDNVHPSRDGTYEGISFHPFETVSWQGWAVRDWAVRVRAVQGWEGQE